MRRSLRRSLMGLSQPTGASHRRVSGRGVTPSGPCAHAHTAPFADASGGRSSVPMSSRRTPIQSSTSANRILMTRVLVALGISLVAGFYFYARSRNAADLTLINFGSEALLNGGNPYRLAGPGMVFDAPWGSLYPATAYVVGIPLLFVSETWGTVVFLCLSTFLLAFGATREGWFRLPMFLSIPFMWSAMQVQWTILFSAAVFLPWI